MSPFELANLTFLFYFVSLNFNWNHEDKNSLWRDVLITFTGGASAGPVMIVSGISLEIFIAGKLCASDCVLPGQQRVAGYHLYFLRIANDVE